jgi:hypothetical protein
MSVGVLPPLVVLFLGIACLVSFCCYSPAQVVSLIIRTINGVSVPRVTHVAPIKSIGNTCFDQPELDIHAVDRAWFLLSNDERGKSKKKSLRLVLVSRMGHYSSTRLMVSPSTVWAEVFETLSANGSLTFDGVPFGNGWEPQPYLMAQVGGSIEVRRGGKPPPAVSHQSQYIALAGLYDRSGSLTMKAAALNATNTLDDLFKGVFGSTCTGLIRAKSYSARSLPASYSASTSFDTIGRLEGVSTLSVYCTDSLWL